MSEWVGKELAGEEESLVSFVCNILLWQFVIAIGGR